MDVGDRQVDDRCMSILWFTLLALILFVAARRWGADTRAPRQWEWDPPQSAAPGHPSTR